MRDESRQRGAPVLRVLAFGLLPSAFCLLLLAFRHFRAEIIGEAAADRPFRAPVVRVVSARNGGPPLLTPGSAALANGAIATGRLEAMRFQPEAAAVGSVVEPLDLAEARTALRAAAPAVTGTPDEPPSPEEATALDDSPPPLPKSSPIRNPQPAARNPQPVPHPSSLAEQVSLALYGPVLTEWLAADAPELAPFFRHQETLLRLTPLPGQAAAAPPEASVTDYHGAAAPARLVAVAFRPDSAAQTASFFYRAPDDPLRPRFAPGMAVLARLPSGPAREGVAVPASAVVWRAGRSWAFVEESPGQFRRRAVVRDLPLPDGAGWLQERGWRAGEGVVTAGAGLLAEEEKDEG